jgi:hypothetical protein
LKSGCEVQWIGLRENLQETMVFTIKKWGFPVNFPLNQSIVKFLGILSFPNDYEKYPAKKTS